MMRGLICIAWCFVLVSCGLGDDLPNLPSEVRPNLPGYLTWAGSDNDTFVYDALGNGYQFSGSNGCIDLPVYGNTGPGLCLRVATPTAYATWGDTFCGYSRGAPDCDSDGFGVYLTNEPGRVATLLAASGTTTNPPKCMAVLGTSTGTSVTGKALNVFYSGENWRLFDVVLATPIIFSAYWDGTIPICGGSSQYVGTYVGTATYTQSVDDTTCVSSAGGESHETLQVTVDSGGVINDDSLRVTGIIKADGTGEFTQQCASEAFTITSSSRNADGKWVLSGGNFEVTQQ
jgi:hypothetical protein